MPHIMKAIDREVTITNYSEITDPFPDVFYLAWVLDLDMGKYTWQSTNQDLMAGDVSK
jgi:hypothetical protein